jgi:capsular polysaccharide biosynthesis protein
MHRYNSSGGRLTRGVSILVQRGPEDWDAGPGLFDSLWRHKWLIALAVLLGMVVAYGWSSRQPVRYEATLQLDFSSVVGQASSDQDPDRVLRNQVELLNSAAVLNRVAKLSDPPLTRAQVRDRVSVEAAGDADVITIRALDATPRQAARLAELVPRAYQQVLKERARRTVASLQRAQDAAEADLASIKAALRAKPGDPSLLADQAAASDELRRAAEAKREAARQSAVQAASAAAQDTDAEVGDQPAQPQPARAAAVGALLGLAVSVALVSWRTGQQLRGPGAGAARPAADAEEPTRDLAVLADAEGSPNGHGEVRLLESVTRQLQRAEAPWRRNRQGRDRRAEPTEVHKPVAGINDFTQLTVSIQRIFRSLEGHRYRLYEQNVPQMAADDIANWFPVDLAVVLLENDQGMLQVAGSVGLSSFEEHMTIEDNRELLLQVVEMGSRMVDEQERSRLAAANVPGSQAQTLIVVPLIYDQVAFGMLLMGQRGDSADQPALVQGDVDRVRVWARDISPYLRAWLLLRYLKFRLRLVQ